MNTFAGELWYDEGQKCTFYSVNCSVDAEDHPCETDKFFDRYNQKGNEFQPHVQAIARLVTTTIGDKYGAIYALFDRFEDQAQALPPKPKPHMEEVAELGSNFPLRLYCLRLSTQIVVLFNGGIKTSATSQESELSMRFYEAKGFAARILKALKEGDLIVSNDGRHLLNDRGGSEIIIY